MRLERVRGGPGAAFRDFVENQRRSNVGDHAHARVGRVPGPRAGTPGEEKTIAYLIEQFKAAGLEPARRERRVDADGADDPHPAAGAGEIVGQRKAGKTLPLRFP